ncbi:MAG: SPASM domain-containing protein [Armatimonadetes bacterium]|nr:SPASM domain-containing protein [Armatimonadota bacterium]
MKAMIPISTNRSYSLHPFKTPDNRAFIFDACSGLFASLSELGYIIICTCLTEEKTSSSMQLLDDYSRVQVEQATADIDSLLMLFDQHKLPPPPKDRSPSPSILLLHTSFACNLSCSYCFVKNARKTNKNIMSLKTIKQSLDWFAEYLDDSKLQGTIAFNPGGEPFISWDLLEFTNEYRKYLEQNHGIKMLLSIITNGTLLTLEKAQELAKKEIIVSGYSIDGPSDIHNTWRIDTQGKGTYQAATQNLRHTLELFPYIAGGATLTPENPYPQRVAEHLLQLGFTTMVIRPVRAASDSPFAFTKENIESLKKGYWEHANWLIEKAQSGDNKTLAACINHYDYFGRFVLKPLARIRMRHGYRCSAAHDMIAVGPDGSLYPCDNFVNMDDFKLGDVWQGFNTQRDIKFGYSSYIEQKENCQSCWARYICGGGCYYCSYLAHYDINIPDPVECNLVLFLIESGIWFTSTLYEECNYAYQWLIERSSA